MPPDSAVRVSARPARSGTRCIAPRSSGWAAAVPTPSVMRPPVLGIGMGGAVVTAPPSCEDRRTRLGDGGLARDLIRNRSRVLQLPALREEVVEASDGDRDADDELEHRDRQEVELDARDADRAHERV